MDDGKMIRILDINSDFMGKDGQPIANGTTAANSVFQ